MFLQKTDRLALVDFENNHINYTEVVNKIKYFSENVIELDKNKFGLIIMENRVEWIYSFFAVWDKKSAPITIDSASNPKEILYVLEDSHPEVIICSNETEKNIKEALLSYGLKDKVKIVNVDNYPIDKEKLEIIKNKEFELYNPE
ncbi:MAG: AMP-binding protein, partial [Pseudoleptotrichia goodfellowii]|nr:AMP-binding protein [Pseudoleptotrichia goodfellowii]